MPKPRRCFELLFKTPRKAGGRDPAARHCNMPSRFDEPKHSPEPIPGDLPEGFVTLEDCQSAASASQIVSALQQPFRGELIGPDDMTDWCGMKVPTPMPVPFGAHSELAIRTHRVRARAAGSDTL